MVNRPSIFQPVGDHTHTHTHTYICMHTQTHTHAHTHTHTHTHACTHRDWLTRLCPWCQRCHSCFCHPCCNKARQLVKWDFEPSQPQRITSQPKTMFNLSPIYSACKSSNHKLSKNHKISPDTGLQKTYTHIKQKFFRRISPFSIVTVKKKHIKLGHAGIVDHSIDSSIPDF